MKKISFLVLSFAILAGCSKGKPEVDTEYPVIDISQAGAFPIQCSSIMRGQKITFKARFTDNVALGSYSLDIHHNFDHHTHSTETTLCDAGPVKTPVKPYLFIQSFDIPEGQKSYDVSAEINIPADVDPGDYHFMIKLTDKEGWQTLKGLSIKLE